MRKTSTIGPDGFGSVANVAAWIGTDMGRGRTSHLTAAQALQTLFNFQAPHQRRRYDRLRTSVCGDFGEWSYLWCWFARDWGGPDGEEITFEVAPGARTDRALLEPLVTPGGRRLEVVERDRRGRRWVNAPACAAESMGYEYTILETLTGVDTIRLEPWEWMVRLGAHPEQRFLVRWYHDTHRDYWGEVDEETYARVIYAEPAPFLTGPALLQRVALDGEKNP